MPTVYAKCIFCLRKDVCFGKNNINLSTWSMSYNEKNFMQKKNVYTFISVFKFRLPIKPSTQGTCAMLGGPLHLELGFAIPIAVQECPSVSSNLVTVLNSSETVSQPPKQNLGYYQLM